MAHVLVTEGEQRAALAVVRSLARAGHRTHVVASRLPSLAGASRHAGGESVAPDPVARPEAYRDAVHRILLDHGVDLLLPTTEAGLLALLELRERLPDVNLPFPPLEVFRRVCDKAEVLSTARALGIAVPEQVVVARPGETGDLARFRDSAVVVKPSRSVVEARDGRRRTQVIHAPTRADLERALASLPSEAFPVLVQRTLHGAGIGVFLLLWKGVLLAAFAHRRILEKPPSGGVSVLRESIPLDPALLGRSRELLERFGWQGVAMVEYKMDDRTGAPVLMEVNGRFWGSLQLAVDAGVDFPALLVAAARGEAVQPVLTYRSGVRSSWWWGEVDHVVARLRSARASGNGNGTARSHGRARKSFLRDWLPPARSEVFRWSDPAPFLRETKDWIAEAARR